jgi:DNA modification methylase
MNAKQTNSKISWTLKKIKLADLKDYGKNPRSLNEKQKNDLKKSLDKFGLIDKPIVNTDNVIIGGHQRVHVLQDTSEKEIECWFPDRTLKEKEVEELNIRLNKNTGEWDFDILANEWEVDDLCLWGFSNSELGIDDALDADDEEGEANETLEPGKDEDAKVKLGDIIELNSHRIVCGDSTLKQNTDLCMNGNKPILMVTDPPYGVEYDPSWRKNIHEKKGVAARAVGKVQNDDKIDWTAAWSLFPGSTCYVWHAGKYCSEVQKSLENCSFEMVSQIVWIKQHFALSRGDYHWQHEPCWYAVKRGENHNWQGARDQSTTWQINNLNAFGGSSEEGEERTAHSTQKPLECMSRPMRNNSKDGDSVYDPFLGSGTTLLSAEKLNRICYGLELSPAYCDIIIQRWVTHMIKNNLEFSVKINGEEVEFDNETD